MLLSLHLCLQAFTVVTVFNAMTFALKVTPFSVKSLSEASVAMDRFRVQLPLPVPPQLQELTLPCGSNGCEVIERIPVLVCVSSNNNKWVT